MQSDFIPLQIEPPSRVLQRVAYRLIVADYHANPHLYGYPPARIEELSKELQAFWPSPAYYIKAAARVVASGLTLRQWRDYKYPPSPRSLYKRRIPRP